jgi:hypothetical protein
MGVTTVRALAHSIVAHRPQAAAVVTVAVILILRHLQLRLRLPQLHLRLRRSRLHPIRRQLNNKVLSMARHLAVAKARSAVRETAAIVD